MPCLHSNQSLREGYLCLITFLQSPGLRYLMDSAQTRFGICHPMLLFLRLSTVWKWRMSWISFSWGQCWAIQYCTKLFAWRSSLCCLPLVRLNEEAPVPCKEHIQHLYLCLCTEVVSYWSWTNCQTNQFDTYLNPKFHCPMYYFHLQISGKKSSLFLSRFSLPRALSSTSSLLLNYPFFHTICAQFQQSCWIYW